MEIRLLTCHVWGPVLLTPVGCDDGVLGCAVEEEEEAVRTGRLCFHYCREMRGSFSLGLPSPSSLFSPTLPSFPLLSRKTSPSRERGTDPPTTPIMAEKTPRPDLEAHPATGDDHISNSSSTSPNSDELVTVEKGYEPSQLHTDLSPEEAHRALRKCDYRLIPLLGVLYLVAFIDRSNIGNARIAGMEEDLNLQGNQYNIAVTMFFVSYG